MIRIIPISLALFIFLTSGSRADEGMWLFNDLPNEYLESTYGFRPTEDWADHLRLSSVRFNSGGSASFVSSNGLVITNHHVASDTLAKLSTADRNIQDDGYLARTPSQELKAPDLELNQLVSIEDVTKRVNAAVKPDMDTGAAFKARRAIMSEIEKESLDETGLRSDVVTLYGGAKYHLYRYRKFTDVRLVWAPESAIAFFGGDADNFEYPRYNLDVTIFRVYEDGKPATIHNYLKWSASGAEEGELVLVSGNPGRTQRIFTTAAMKYLRDKRHPYVLDLLRRLEVMLQQYCLGGDEQIRRAKDDVHGVQNSRKAYTGMLQGLQTPSFIQSKAEQEEALLKKLQSNPEWKGWTKAWDDVAEVQKAKAELLGITASLRSRYFELAETLVHMAREDQKPNATRMRDYRDSARESLEQDLFSPAPIYDDLEQAKLADSIARFVEFRGGDHPLCGVVLNGKSPRERAAELVNGTKLGNIDYRRELAKGGNKAIDGSTDPMIVLARNLESEYRRLRELRDEHEEAERQAYAKITKATIAVQGTSTYPDATFTLRLAFGPVKGYVEDGKQVPPFTTLGGAFSHAASHNDVEPWELPKSWQEHKGDLDLKTPFNFVCTADIIGGNSGSPVVNRKGEFVGIIFDGNIQSLTADLFYSDEVGRAVSVHSSAIREVLRKVYDADFLADQLGN